MLRQPLLLHRAGASELVRVVCRVGRAFAAWQARLLPAFGAITSLDLLVTVDYEVLLLGALRERSLLGSTRGSSSVACLPLDTLGHVLKVEDGLLCERDVFS